MAAVAPEVYTSSGGSGQRSGSVSAAAEPCPRLDLGAEQQQQQQQAPAAGAGAQADVRAACAAAAVCRDWAAAARNAQHGAPLQAKIWDGAQARSLESYLRSRSRVASLDLTAAPAEPGGCPALMQASVGLAGALPASLRELRLADALAVPLLVLAAAQRCPSLESLALAQLPAKWTYAAGALPWPADAAAAAEQLAPGPVLRGITDEAVQRELYGVAVYRRFRSYWRTYELALAALLAVRGAGLRELCLEAPARCVGRRLLQLMTHPPGPAACSLESLALRGFGGRPTMSRLAQAQVGLLCAAPLPRLAGSLTSLALVGCGTEPLPAASLEALTGLQALSLRDSTMVWADGPPDLRALSRLTSLDLRRSEWLLRETAAGQHEPPPSPPRQQRRGSRSGSERQAAVAGDGGGSGSGAAAIVEAAVAEVLLWEPWSDREPQPLLLPPSLESLDVIGFSCVAYVDLTPLERLTALAEAGDVPLLPRPACDETAGNNRQRHQHHRSTAKAAAAAAGAAAEPAAALLPAPYARLSTLTCSYNLRHYLSAAVAGGFGAGRQWDSDGSSSGDDVESSEGGSDSDHGHGHFDDAHADQVDRHDGAQGRALRSGSSNASCSSSGGSMSKAACAAGGRAEPHLQAGAGELHHAAAVAAEVAEAAAVAMAHCATASEDAKVDFDQEPAGAEVAAQPEQRNDGSSGSSSPIIYNYQYMKAVAAQQQPQQLQQQQENVGTAATAVHLVPQQGLAQGPASAAAAAAQPTTTEALLAPLPSPPSAQQQHLVAAPDAAATRQTWLLPLQPVQPVLRCSGTPRAHSPWQPPSLLLPPLACLELQGVLPHEVQPLLPHLCLLTRLAFMGQMGDGQGDENATDDRDEVTSLCVAAGCLPLLEQLTLNIGLLGYGQLDLQALTRLTRLVVDSCEYVDVRYFKLPASLRYVNLAAWYGLPELFHVAESGAHAQGLHAASGYAFPHEDRDSDSSSSGSGGGSSGSSRTSTGNSTGSRPGRGGEGKGDEKITRSDVSGSSSGSSGGGGGAPGAAAERLTRSLERHVQQQLRNRILPGLPHLQELRLNWDVVSGLAAGGSSSSGCDGGSALAALRCLQELEVLEVRWLQQQLPAAELHLLALACPRLRSLEWDNGRCKLAKEGHGSWLRRCANVAQP